MKNSMINFKSTFIPSKELGGALDYAINTRDLTILNNVKSALNDGKNHEIEFKNADWCDTYSGRKYAQVNLLVDGEYKTSEY